MSSPQRFAHACVASYAREVAKRARARRLITRYERAATELRARADAGAIRAARLSRQSRRRRSHFGELDAPTTEHGGHLEFPAERLDVTPKR